jgi:hypothetical protein
MHLFEAAKSLSKTGYGYNEAKSQIHNTHHWRAYTISCRCNLNFKLPTIQIIRSGPIHT